MKALLLLLAICAQDKVELTNMPTIHKPDPVKTTAKIFLNKNGHNYMISGTIIYSSYTDVYILSCAHWNLFPVNDFKVHIGDNVYDGTLVDYSREEDISLIKAPVANFKIFTPVVPRRWSVKQKMRVISYGYCRESFSKYDTTVNDIDKTQEVLYGEELVKIKGIECDKLTNGGVSGGGLFTENGYLIGTCVGTHEASSSSLFTGPNQVYKILSKNKLGFLIR